MRRTTLGVALLAAATLTTGQAGPRAQAPQTGADAPANGQAASPDQPPVFRTGINFVPVDVIVTDRDGNPVQDLTAEDFVITEDGKPQPIEAFKLVEFDSGLVPGPDGPPRAIRTEADEQIEAAR